VLNCPFLSQKLREIYRIYGFLSALWLCRKGKRKSRGYLLPVIKLCHHYCQNIFLSVLRIFSFIICVKKASNGKGKVKSTGKEKGQGQGQGIKEPEEEEEPQEDAEEEEPQEEAEEEEPQEDAKNAKSGRVTLQMYVLCFGRLFSKNLEFRAYINAAIRQAARDQAVADLIMPSEEEVEEAIKACRSRNMDMVPGEIKHRLKIITLLAQLIDANYEAILTACRNFNK
jgi:hypothetical protein